ncbi:MAG TPA: hypothetical protein ENK10_05000 [Acidobacteria bacterium]|nr:hypothetical protein [Acidobacteriota bacterium]
MLGMRKTCLALVSALLCAGVGLSALALPAADDAVPKEDREHLEQAVKDFIEEIYEQKDEEERHFQKARSSMSFEPIDGGRYQVVAYKDIVEEGGRTMRTERYRLTLEKESDEQWKISEQVLEDTVTGMSRYMPGDEKFFTFDGFHFDREGLKVDSGPGSLIVFFRNGKRSSMLFTGRDLSYSYQPPPETDLDARYRAVKNLKSRDFDFVPELASLRCSEDLCGELLETLFEGLTETTREKIDAKSGKEYDRRIREMERSRRENYLSGFRFDDLPGNEYYTLLVKKKGKDHFLGLRYDNWAPKEVSFVVSGYWPALFTYYSEQTRSSGKSVYELERRPDEDGRFFDVVSVKGSVDLQTKTPETMDADIHYQLRAREDFDRLGFGIVVMERSDDEKKSVTRPRLTVSYIKDGEGKELSWVQLGPNYGMVIFPRTIKKGEIIPLEMKFSNGKAVYDFSWSYKYMARGGWLPFVRFADMIDEFELTISVPEQYTTLGIGKKMAERVADGRRITEWKAFHPVTFPTIIFGKYTKAESTVQARKLDGTPIPVTIYVDENALTEGSAASGQWGIRPKQLQPLVDQAAQAINLYERLYGVDYPYSKLDLVNDPIGGALYGQAPSSIIYLGSLVFRGAATLESFGGGRGVSKFLKSVVAHETGHQWWGASTSNFNSGNYWFVESLAEYSSAIYTEQAYGRKAYLQQVKAWHDDLVQADTMCSVQDGYTAWGGPLGGYGNQRNIYSRGPYAFHILRETFGDKKFFNYLYNLAQKLAQKQIVTEDMKMISEVVFGADMSWFWDQWIRGVGLPEYAFKLSTRQTEDGKYLVEGTVRQRVVIGPKNEVLEGRYFRGAIPVTVFYTDGTREKKPVLVEGELTEVRFKVDKKPQKVVFNGEGEILAERMIPSSSF